MADVPVEEMDVVQIGLFARTLAEERQEWNGVASVGLAARRRQITSAPLPVVNRFADKRLLLFGRQRLQFVRDEWTIARPRVWPVPRGDDDLALEPAQVGNIADPRDGARYLLVEEKRRAPAAESFNEEPRGRLHHAAVLSAAGSNAVRQSSS